MNGFIKTSGGISVAVDGKPYLVNAGNKALYDAVLALVKAGKFSEVPATVDRLGNLVSKIAEKKQGYGTLTIRDRRVYFVHENGEEQRLVGFEVTKLLELLDEGFDIKPLSNFIIRVRQNPSEAIRSRLYEFMEYGNLPLTEDGSFLAYKVVRNNYLDKYSGKFDNSVGKTCEMPRNDVNDNDAQTCSSGLHVCSKEYIKHFLYSGGDKLMVTQVAPEDVVSIPVDYNNTKMRTCKYTVIGEVKEQDDPEFFGKAIYRPAAVTAAAEAAPVLDRLGRPMPKRDALGHFVKS